MEGVRLEVGRGGGGGGGGRDWGLAFFLNMVASTRQATVIRNTALYLPGFPSITRR